MEHKELDKLLSNTGVKKSFIGRLFQKLHHTEKVYTIAISILLVLWGVLRSFYSDSMYSLMLGCILLGISTFVIFRMVMLRMTFNQAINPFFHIFFNPNWENVGKAVLFLLVIAIMLIIGYITDGIAELEKGMQELKKY